MKRAAAWVLPCLLCLAVFWPGLECWFQQDDFAWLGLRLQVHNASDLMRALFEPKAQGTIRPWSERVFFMAFSALFGLDALPYRLLVFATQMLNLWLLSRIAWRLSGGSVAAAAAAPALWGVNAALGTPLTWTSAYNQVLCAAFVLGAFLIWLRFVETRAWRFYAAQWAVFVLGFGALEINVVYPAIAAAHALLVAPRMVVYALPMGAVSAAYTLLHNHFAPKVRTGPYALHVDASMLSTLGTYWNHAFGAHELGNLDVPGWFQQLGRATPLVLSLLLGSFVLAALVRRRRLGVLFGLAWFVIAIGPVLPLRDHVSDYYLTLPTVGLALLGAEAVAAAATAGPAWTAVALAGALAYGATSGMVARATAVYNRERSQEAERLVFGVERARQIHPKKAILLSGLSDDLFWSAMNDKAFRLVGVEEVYLAPGSEGGIQAHPDLGDVGEYVFPAGQVVRLLERGEGVVYSVESGRLRNVTAAYRALARTRWKPELARRIDLGNGKFEEQLGEGWHEEESGYRWMARRAVVWLAGPDKPGQRLSVNGFVPASQVAAGAVTLRATVDGTLCPVLRLEKPDAEFHLECPLAGGMTGRERVEVVLDVDRVFVPPGDGRQLGVAFGTVAIH